MKALWIVFLIVTTLVTSACTSVEPAPATGTPAAAPPAATSAPAAPSQPAAPSAPVASLEIDTSNTEDDVVSLRFDVVSLERDGANTRLGMTITNLSDEFDYTPFNDLGASATADFTLSGVSLIDLTADLRHLVLIDTEGNCVCSDVGSTTVTTGSTVDVQASFPSPAADEVDIQLGELGVVAAVPVTDR